MAVPPNPVTLESLPLDAARLQAAREEIQQSAYFKWEKAGRPGGDSDRFWREAEYEWIEFRYVPSRPLEKLPTERETDARKLVGAR
jgi:hypothetical protein